MQTTKTNDPYTQWLDAASNMDEARPGSLRFLAFTMAAVVILTALSLIL